MTCTEPVEVAFAELRTVIGKTHYPLFICEQHTQPFLVELTGRELDSPHTPNSRSMDSTLSTLSESLPRRYKSRAFRSTLFACLFAVAA